MAVRRYVLKVSIESNEVIATRTIAFEGPPQPLKEVLRRAASNAETGMLGHLGYRKIAEGCPKPGCPTCGGRGVVADERCLSCGGEG